MSMDDEDCSNCGKPRDVAGDSRCRACRTGVTCATCFGERFIPNRTYPGVTKPCPSCTGCAEDCGDLRKAGSKFCGNHQPVATGAVKHDADKPRYDLLPWDALEVVAKVMGYGAKKYTKYGECSCHVSRGSGFNGHSTTCESRRIVSEGRHNYRKGMAWTRLARAAIGHIVEWLKGNDLDEESGLPHLGHAGASVLMLMSIILLKRGEDDRFKP